VVGTGAEHPDAGVGGRDGLSDLGGGVGRAVVDDQDSTAPGAVDSWAR
jgi:hypothetical protein